MFKALIFDVDGTLAETEEAHRQAFNDTFPEFGLDWHWSRDLYRVLLKTTGGKERMREYAASHLQIDPADIPVADIHKRKTTRYGELIATGLVPLRPGIASLIADATSNGLRLAVAVALAGRPPGRSPGGAHRGLGACGWGLKRRARRDDEVRCYGA